MQGKDNKWFGPFRAVVVDVDDPLNLDRVKAHVPEILGNTPTDWIWPKHAAPSWSWKPVVGERIWVEFEGGDVDRPLYSGAWYPQVNNESSIPSEVLAAYARTRLIKSPAGHKIVFKDADPDDGTADSGITIESVFGHKVELKDGDNDQSIVVSTLGGHSVKLDDKNTTVTIAHSDGTTKIDIDSSGKVSITANGDVEVTGTNVNLKGGGGAIPTFPVVCAGTAAHPCSFTGGPHPAGSANVKASQ